MFWENLTKDGVRISISDVKMSTDFLWIKTDRHRLICFCIATKFVLCHKIWSWTKTLQPINYQIDFINFFLSKISSDRNVCFSTPFICYCYNKKYTSNWNIEIFLLILSDPGWFLIGFLLDIQTRIYVFRDSHVIQIIL